MEEFCAGWLGWTEQQTLDATLSYIDAARRGRFAMLTAIFGGGPAKDAPAKTSKRAVSEGLFDALFPGKKR